MAAESVAACRAVLEVLCSHEDAEAFLEAVDWRGLGLPDYPKVIKRPMDLGKVTLRIRTARRHAQPIYSVHTPTTLLSARLDRLIAGWRRPVTSRARCGGRRRPDLAQRDEVRGRLVPLRRSC